MAIWNHPGSLSTTTGECLQGDFDFSITPSSRCFFTWFVHTLRSCGFWCLTPHCTDTAFVCSSIIGSGFWAQHCPYSSFKEQQKNIRKFGHGFRKKAQNQIKALLLTWIDLENFKRFVQTKQSQDRFLVIEKNASVFTLPMQNGPLMPFLQEKRLPSGNFATCEAFTIPLSNRPRLMNSYETKDTITPVSATFQRWT